MADALHMDQVLQTFAQFDKCGDGKISLSDLVEVLQILDKDAFDSASIKDLFGGDEGMVDVAGFAAWLYGKSEHKTFLETPDEMDLDELDVDTAAVDDMLAQARAKFDSLDKNQNGLLEAKELNQLCTWAFDRFGRRFKSEKEKSAAIEKQVQRYMKQGSEWDFDTFEAYYLKLTANIERYEAKRSQAFEEGYSKSKAAAKFKELDSDGSGFLEGKELEVFATWIFESLRPDGMPLTDAQKQDEARKLLDKIMLRTDQARGNSDGKLSFSEVDFYIEEKIAQIEDFKKRATEREAKRQAKEAEKQAAKEAKRAAKAAKGGGGKAEGSA
eukprot:TRINITY_DN24639_c0_g1_i1.p1 TRINITY_DN24639_c0_g1~~TRINITY_DN24639_c0_g1_i1.p1  ORF type:complete len:345 (+),score=97.97 TRINITY_DN24639_c0_g1_i1:54-1037(+)